MCQLCVPEGWTTSVLLCTGLSVLRLNSAYSGCTPRTPAVLRVLRLYSVYAGRTPGVLWLNSAHSGRTPAVLQAYSGGFYFPYLGCTPRTPTVLRVLRLHSVYSTRTPGTLAAFRLNCTPGVLRVLRVYSVLLCTPKI